MSCASSSLMEIMNLYPLRLRILDSTDDYCLRALNKAMQCPRVFDLFRVALHNLNSVTIQYDERSDGASFSMENRTYRICLGNRSKVYYFTKASKEDFPEHFLKYFTPDELTKVGISITPEAALVHEFYHLFHSTTYSDFRKKLDSPSKVKDMNNEEEERTILYGENPYHEECEEPTRIDHLSTSYPPYAEMLSKSKDEQASAFLDYLTNGSHLEAIKLSEQFKNEELEKLLSGLFKSTTIIKDWRELTRIRVAAHFLEILLAIIEERKLNINFSDPKWKTLYNVCLINIQKADQFKKLQELKAGDRGTLLHPEMSDSDLFIINNINHFLRFLKSVLESHLFEILKIQDQFGLTALHLLIEKYSQSLVLNVLNKIPVTDLVDLLKIEDYKGDSPLHMAIKMGYKTLVLKILEKIPRVDLIDVLKRQDEWGKTVLHWLIAAGYRDIVIKILENMSEGDLVCLFKIQDNWGATALHLAIVGDFENLVLKLLRNLSERNRKDLLNSRDGNSTLHWTIKRRLERCSQMLSFSALSKPIATKA